MCLQTTWKKPKIAEKDIICYKEMIRLGDKENVVFGAYFIEFNYVPNKLYKTTMKKSDDSGSYDTVAGYLKNKYLEEGYTLYNIGQGFHSTKKASRISLCTSNSVIVRCIIPKGAKYYEGLSDLLVSNQIIVTNKVIKKYNK